MPSTLARLFPLWALLLSGLAYVQPAPFAQGQAAILPLLMLIMLGMGMSLMPGDFVAIGQRKRYLGLGLALQFSVMPLAAMLCSTLLQLEPELMVGMVLVGAASGGTASNLITYLARGNLALSIAMTACSTLLAVALMPLIVELLLGRTVPVPAGSLLLSIAEVVIAPVFIGMLLRHFFGGAVERVQAWTPLLSVLAICLIVAIIVALNHDHIASSGPRVALAVVLHNGLGLAAGYWAARAVGADRRDARTLAIEVGMQNSGLAVALAIQYFGAISALPGALFSIWHNLSGSALAACWNREKTS